jgi:Fic family protein
MTRTLERFRGGIETVPADVAWYLSDLGRSLGRQQLFSAQAPQKLKALKEHAIVESAISSNRMEGVEVDDRRVGTLVFGKATATDRNEEEVRGYRLALDWIHSDAASIECDEENTRRLHALARGDIWDAGRYKERDGDIIERSPGGETRVRFRTVPAADTPGQMSVLFDLWDRCVRERWVAEPVAIAAHNLDFLCIHPFRDGNGRVSRLLLLLQSYRLGYEVGRYISLERIIERNKDRYYEALEQSSTGWHEGGHDPWPYIRYILFVFKEAYRELEARLGDLGEPRGAKTQAVLAAIGRVPGTFTVAGLRAQCPGVSVDMIRRVLKDLRAEGRVECLGRGRDSRWQKTERFA